MADVWDEAGLCALAAEWRELHSQTAHPSPFTSWEWARMWWRHFGETAQDGRERRRPPGRRLRIVTVRDQDGPLLAIAPFYCSRPHSRLLSREMRLLGDDGRDGEGMTDEPTLLLRRGRESEATRALLRHLLLEQPHDDWDFLKVRLPHQAASSLNGTAPHGPGDIPPSFRVRREEGSQVVALPQTWDLFHRALSRSMRDNLAYYPRRLTRHEHLWRVELVREPGEIGPAVDILVDLHNQRAHSGRGVAHVTHIPGARQAAFLRECLPRLAASGMATVALLWVGGQPVAAQAFLESGAGTSSGHELVMYYSGFRPEWHGYSPVTLLGAAAIRDAIQRGLTRLNFLPGAMPWKERWGTRAQDTIADVRCLRPRARSLARAFCRSALRWVSAFGKAVTPEGVRTGDSRP